LDRSTVSTFDRAVELAAFRKSLNTTGPPDGLGPVLRALWHEANGDWNRAHEIVQDEEGAEAAWVHAYLHRKEGDLSNAGYWYRRAGKPVPKLALSEEWELIVAALLTG
jgi:hypothetical protein